MSLDNLIKDMYRYIQGTIVFEEVIAYYAITPTEASLLEILPEECVRALRDIIEGRPTKAALSYHNLSIILRLFKRFQNQTPVQEYLCL